MEEFDWFLNSGRILLKQVTGRWVGGGTGVGRSWEEMRQAGQKEEEGGDGRCRAWYTVSGKQLQLIGWLELQSITQHTRCVCCVCDVCAALGSRGYSEHCGTRAWHLDWYCRVFSVAAQTNRSNMLQLSGQQTAHAAFATDWPCSRPDCRTFTRFWSCSPLGLGQNGLEGISKTKWSGPGAAS